MRFVLNKGIMIMDMVFILDSLEECCDTECSRVCEKLLYVSEGFAFCSLDVTVLE